MIKKLLLLIILGTLSAPLLSQTRIFTERGFPGHSWITIGDTVLYSFGNYTKNTKSINALLPGKGVLIRLEDKNWTGDIWQYLKSRSWQEKTAKVDLSRYCDSLFQSGTGFPTRGIYKDDPRASVIGKYRPLKYNCTTFIGKALKFKHHPITPMGLRRKVSKLPLIAHDGPVLYNYPDIIPRTTPKTFWQKFDKVVDLNNFKLRYIDIFHAIGTLAVGIGHGWREASIAYQKDLDRGLGIEPVSYWGSQSWVLNRAADGQLKKQAWNWTRSGKHGVRTIGTGIMLTSAFTIGFDKKKSDRDKVLQITVESFSLLGTGGASFAYFANKAGK